MLCRALYRVVSVPNTPAPYDRLWLKVYYPAEYTGTPAEMNTGILPVVADNAPYPVVIFCNGSNVASWCYQWLAEALVQQQLVVVLFDYVNEIMPNAITLTSGIDLAAVQPAHYGTRPTLPTLAPLLAELAQMNSSGTLAGRLDVANIILGGHSAGGTLVLHAVNAKLHPQVKAIFTYAAHTLPAAFFGYPTGQVIPVAAVPVLLLAGDHDSVIAASRQRYGESTLDPIELTYQQGKTHDMTYIVLRDAGHFAITYPLDTTTGRHFLGTEPPATPELRAFLVTLITQFIEREVRHNATVQFEPAGAFIAHFEQK